MYVYGVIGVHLLAKIDPDHWGSLARAASTLFQILTLEGWVEILAAGREGHPAAWLFYASFIVIAVFVVINLFIAVVINNLETTRREEEIRSAESTAAHIQALRAKLMDLSAATKRLHRDPGFPVSPLPADGIIEALLPGCRWRECARLEAERDWYRAANPFTNTKGRPAPLHSTLRAGRQ
jgi:hypothetical protein